MERRPPRSHYPSFSSSLLDAIYRSLDSDAKTTTKNSPKSRSPYHSRSFSFLSSSAPRTKTPPKPKFKSSWAPTSSSSSSSSSSFGFSSSASSLSDADFSRPNPPPSTPPHERNKNKKKTKPTIRSRLSELRKKSSPAASSSPSPTSPLASLLKSLFSSARITRKKPKAPPFNEEPSCLPMRRKLAPPPPPQKRSVRFVDEGCRQREKTKCICDADLEAGTAAKRKVEQLLRVLEEEEDEEMDEESSDSSSDLFELKNLSAIGWDELPVYETTNFGTNRAIAQGLIA